MNQHTEKAAPVAAGTANRRKDASMTECIPFHGTEIVAQLIDGIPHVALRPLCESLGLSYSGQRERLQRQPWAVVRVTRTTGADGKRYDMTMVDRRTFTMWLATIQTSRIKACSTPIRGGARDD